LRAPIVKESTMSKFVVAACLCLIGVPAFAHAQESDPVVSAKGPEKPFSAGLLIDYGTDFGEDPNPWGFGFGLRGGYSLDRMYFGIRFLYQLGSSIDVVGSGLNTIEISYNLWEFSLEGGYDFPLQDKLTLRPSLLLGVANLISSSDDIVFGGEAVSGSDLKLLISPGASILYDLTPEIFIGADLRLPLVIGGGSIVGLVLYANGGIHF
jgi:hypothetical protein